MVSKEEVNIKTTKAKIAKDKIAKIKKEGFKEVVKVRVRYAETDMMGVAHHSAYIVWAEEARSEYMRKMNFPYSKLEKMGISLPVIELNIRYIKPAFYEDELTVYIKPIITRRKIVMEFVISREEELIARGKTIHVPVSRKTLMPMKLPEDVYKSLLKN